MYLLTAGVGVLSKQPRHTEIRSVSVYIALSGVAQINEDFIPFRSISKHSLKSSLRIGSSLMPSIRYGFKRRFVSKSFCDLLLRQSCLVVPLASRLVSPLMNALTVPPARVLAFPRQLQGVLSLSKLLSRHGANLVRIERDTLTAAGRIDV